MMLPTVVPIALQRESPLSTKHVQGAIRCIAGTLELGGNIPKTDTCSTLELCLSLED